MPFFQRWRRRRELHRKASEFVAVLLREPAAEDVSWLAQVAARGDEDHATWELRYARYAIGLLAAQRDALDDRTSALVAQSLSAAFGTDRRIDRDRSDLFERQFNGRLSAYREAMGSRAPDVAVRLGQTLLAFSGGAFRDVDADVERAGAVMASYDSEASDALRSVFGDAVLPENVPPSAVAGNAAT